MSPPKRGTRRIKHSSKQPPEPGLATCAPLAVNSTRRKKERSCLPEKILKKIVKSEKLCVRNKKNTRNVLANTLDCTSGNERCLVKKSHLDEKEKKDLLQTYFRPEMPDEWRKKIDTWLNSDDITNVMKQYENAYKEFKFLGVVPIDFSAPDPYKHVTDKHVTDKQCMNEVICKVNLKKEKKDGHTILGVIFNLDPHYKGGSHWVGLVIDLKKNHVYYFDSYGVSPPKQISRFMRYLTLQEPKLRLESNGRRFQFSNTECGMYSLYFIIRMIEGDSFKDFCKHPISDNWMIKFRKILFDETADKNAL